MVAANYSLFTFYFSLFYVSLHLVMRKLALFSMLLLPLAVLAQKQYVLPTVECPNDSLAEGQRISQQVK